MTKTREILKLIVDDFVLGGHLIATGALSIVLASAFLLNIKITWSPLVVVYLLTYSSILYNRYKEQKIDYLTNPGRTKNLNKYFKQIKFIILLTVFFSVLILIYHNKFTALLFILLLFIFTIFYTEYFKWVTKKIIAFKNFYFSLLISLALVFLAIYYSYPFLNLSFLFVFIFVFLRMFVNTVFLDIKDAKSDKQNQLLTLPIVITDKNKVLKILKIITVFSASLIIFAYYFNLLPGFSLMLLLIVPYTFYYFKKSENEKNFYLVNYILADFEFVLWPVFIIIGKIFL